MTTAPATSSKYNLCTSIKARDVTETLMLPQPAFAEGLPCATRRDCTRTGDLGCQIGVFVEYYNYHLPTAFAAPDNRAINSTHRCARTFTKSN